MGILSIIPGFEAIKEVGGINAVNAHTMIVTRYLYEEPFNTHCQRIKTARASPFQRIAAPSHLRKPRESRGAAGAHRHGQRA